MQPGLYGKPLFHHHMRKQILDGLHLAELGLPKTPWKHGVKNNASNEARGKIGDLLKSYKHPLDMATKEEGRVRPALPSVLGSALRFLPLASS